jgi:PIN domain nuclease of toxin-antitoxin system
VTLLLDTHAFIWWVADAPQLSAPAREAIGTAPDVALSAASVWEMAIKASRGKLELADDIGAFVAGELDANGFRGLPISLRHAAAVRSLPHLHRDPFDRLLFAQALLDDLTLVTAETDLAGEYGVRAVW